jgi:hypothetical protein
MAKREVWDLRKIVGLRETKGLRVWLIVATFRKYRVPVYILWVQIESMIWDDITGTAVADYLESKIC